MPGHIDRTRGFVEKPELATQAWHLPVVPPRGSMTDLHAHPPEQLLDHRFELLAPLGASALARIWRGRDVDLQREVLVTVLASQLHEDPTTREQFRAETGRIAGLTDLVFPSQFDLVVNERASYCVSELVPGAPLPALQRAPDLSASVITAVGHQLAWGLADAHAQDLAHRCLHPGSMIVGGDGRVRIIDMALARLGQSLRAEREVAHPDEHYVAPEQRDGAPGDGRSDVFSLGRVLRELIPSRPAGPPRQLGRGLAGANQRAWEMLEQRLERMTAPDPHQRPTAADTVGLLDELTIRRDELLLKEVMQRPLGTPD